MTEEGYDLIEGQHACRRPQPTWLWWTGGKDSAWALNVLKEDSCCQVGGLISAVNRGNKRSAAHGVKQELLEEQAAAVGLPLRLVEFDWRRPCGELDAKVQRVLTELHRTGVEAIAYGDLSCSPSRMRSSVQLAGTGLAAIFPLWGLDSREHAETMLKAELSAWVCSSYTHLLPQHYVGRRYDAELLDDLPPSVDPCGEMGEFHTFVEWAPGWNRRVSVAPTRSIDTYIFAFSELGRKSGDTPAGRKRAQTPTDKRIDKTDRSGATEYDPFKYFKRLRRVRKHVIDHLQEDLTMDGVARVAAMSAPAFGRYFRRHVGMRFGIWLAKQRTGRACALLRETDETINAIASAAGFGSGRSFRRAFREHVGISPSDYKKRYLLDQAGAQGSAGA